MATDTRLWLLGEVKEVEAALKGLIRVMVERADQEKDLLLPGYTHLQVSRKTTTLIVLVANLYVYSEDSQFGGHIFSFPMLSLSTPTFNASSNSFPEFPFYHLVVVLWQETPSSLTVNS